MKNWLLDKLSPYPTGYVPYIEGGKIARRRMLLVAYVRSFSLGFLVMYLIAILWVGHVRHENDEVFRKSSLWRHQGEAEASSRRENLGEEIYRRTVAENELRKHGIPIPKY